MAYTNTCPRCGYIHLNYTKNLILEVLNGVTDPVSISEIHRFIHIAYKNTHDAVGKLIKLGYIKQIKDYRIQGQKCYLTLTEKGKEYLNK